ncbi:hypothetical protein L7F22_022744 [Adiantum nelumboides]|nr:hypothetical protein [Adiantum nelumboides]
MTSLKAIKQVVYADPFCWAVREDGTRNQVACIVLVCWFHTKKAWVEHLLPKVRRNPFLCLSTCRLQVYVCFSPPHLCIVPKEMRNHVYTWRRLWPKFGHLFPHGDVDTTNLVERHWQYVKYTLLDAQINRSVLALLHALIGDSVTKMQMGGTVVEFF